MQQPPYQPPSTPSASSPAGGGPPPPSQHDPQQQYRNPYSQSNTASGSPVHPYPSPLQQQHHEQQHQLPRPSSQASHHSIASINVPPSQQHQHEQQQHQQHQQQHDVYASSQEASPAGAYPSYSGTEYGMPNASEAPTFPSDEYLAYYPQPSSAEYHAQEYQPQQEDQPYDQQQQQQASSAPPSAGAAGHSDYLNNVRSTHQSPYDPMFLQQQQQQPQSQPQQSAESAPPDSSSATMYNNEATHYDHPVDYTQQYTFSYQSDAPSDHATYTEGGVYAPQAQQPSSGMMQQQNHPGTYQPTSSLSMDNRPGSSLSLNDMRPPSADPTVPSIQTAFASRPAAGPPTSSLKDSRKTGSAPTSAGGTRKNSGGKQASIRWAENELLHIETLPNPVDLNPMLNAERKDLIENLQELSVFVAYLNFDDHISPLLQQAVDSFPTRPETHLSAICDATEVFFAYQQGLPPLPTVHHPEFSPLLVDWQLFPMNALQPTTLRAFTKALQNYPREHLEHFVEQLALHLSLAEATGPYAAETAGVIAKRLLTQIILSLYPTRPERSFLDDLLQSLERQGRLRSRMTTWLAMQGFPFDDALDIWIQYGLPFVKDTSESGLFNGAMSLEWVHLLVDRIAQADHAYHLMPNNLLALIMTAHASINPFTQTGASNPALQSLRPILGNIQCLILKKRLRCDMASLFHHLLLYCSPMASRTEPQVSAEIQNWQMVLMQHHMQDVSDKWIQLLCRPTGSNPNSPVQTRSPVASGSLAVLVPSSIVLLHRIATSWHGLSLHKRLDGEGLIQISQTFAETCHQAQQDWPRSMFKANNVSKEQADSLAETCEELIAAIRSASSMNAAAKRMSDSDLHGSDLGSSQTLYAAYGSGNSTTMLQGGGSHTGSNHHLAGGPGNGGGNDDDGKSGNKADGTAIRSPRLRRRSSGRVNPIASPPMLVPTPAPNFEKLASEKWSLFTRSSGGARSQSRERAGWLPRLKWVLILGILASLLWIHTRCDLPSGPSTDGDAISSSFGKVGGALCQADGMYGAPFYRLKERWASLVAYTGALHVAILLRPTLTTVSQWCTPIASTVLGWLSATSPVFLTVHHWLDRGISGASSLSGTATRTVFSATPPVFQNKTLFLFDSFHALKSTSKGFKHYLYYLAACNALAEDYIERPLVRWMTTTISFFDRFFFDRAFFRRQSTPSSSSSSSSPASSSPPITSPLGHSSVDVTKSDAVDPTPSAELVEEKGASEENEEDAFPEVDLPEEEEDGTKEEVKEKEEDGAMRMLRNLPTQQAFRGRAQQRAERMKQYAEGAGRPPIEISEEVVPSSTSPPIPSTSSVSPSLSSAAPSSVSSSSPTTTSHSSSLSSSTSAASVASPSASLPSPPSSSLSATTTAPTSTSIASAATAKASPISKVEVEVEVTPPTSKEEEEADGALQDDETSIPIEQPVVAKKPPPVVKEAERTSENVVEDAIPILSPLDVESDVTRDDDLADDEAPLDVSSPPLSDPEVVMTEEKEIDDEPPMVDEQVPAMAPPTPPRPPIHDQVPPKATSSAVPSEAVAETEEEALDAERHLHVDHRDAKTGDEGTPKEGSEVLPHEQTPPIAPPPAEEHIADTNEPSSAEPHDAFEEEGAQHHEENEQEEEEEEEGGMEAEAEADEMADIILDDILLSHLGDTALPLSADLDADLDGELVPAMPDALPNTPENVPDIAEMPVVPEVPAISDGSRSSTALSVVPPETRSESKEPIAGTTSAAIVSSRESISSSSVVPPIMTTLATQATLPPRAQTQPTPMATITGATTVADDDEPFYKDEL